MSRPGHVLSIQSHVVSGCVGNNAAVFPLQLLGIEVDAINTVQFSNHTGYPSFRGKVLSAQELWDLIEGMEANGLLSHYTHLLTGARERACELAQCGEAQPQQNFGPTSTGFIGSLALLQTIQKILIKLRQFNPDLVYGENARAHACTNAIPELFT